MKLVPLLSLLAIPPATFAASLFRAEAKIDQPVAWELCAPCVPGGYVNILGQRSVHVNITGGNCVRLTAIYNNSGAYAVFPDGSTGTVSGTESIHYDYCHSHKFRIRAYFSITHKDGQTYHYREVRTGVEGDPIQIGWDCDGFSCGGEKP